MDFPAACAPMTDMVWECRSELTGPSWREDCWLGPHWWGPHCVSWRVQQGHSSQCQSLLATYQQLCKYLLIIKFILEKNSLGMLCSCLLVGSWVGENAISEITSYPFISLPYYLSKANNAFHYYISYFLWKISTVGSTEGKKRHRKKRNEQRPLQFFLMKIYWHREPGGKLATLHPYLSLLLVQKQLYVLLILKWSSHFGRACRDPESLPRVPLVSRAGNILASASASTPVPSAACTMLCTLFQKYICSNFVSYLRSQPLAELQLAALRILEETHFRGKCLLQAAPVWPVVRISFISSMNFNSENCTCSHGPQKSTFYDAPYLLYFGWVLSIVLKLFLPNLIFKTITAE